MFTDGDAEMDLVSDLFANGKVSRLYKALVYERRIASEVMAFQNSRELGGFWQVAGDGRSRPLARRVAAGDRRRARAG